MSANRFNIPLVIPNFNQLTYLRNLINWWRYYAPGQHIYIIDNASDYTDLEDYYDIIIKDPIITVKQYPTNECANNLAHFLTILNCDYYCLSDPDISPHPATPPDFLDIFRYCIEKMGYHHVGFNLIIDDLPDWLHEKAMIIENEKHQRRIYDPIEVSYLKRKFLGNKSPIDTTFAMYKNGKGWYAPQEPDDWKNSLRLFDAFHLGWYTHPDHVTPEMDHYFKTSKYRIAGEPVSAGKNNNRPKQYL